MDTTPVPCTPPAAPDDLSGCLVAGAAAVLRGGDPPEAGLWLATPCRRTRRQLAAELLGMPLIWSDLEGWFRRMAAELPGTPWVRAAFALGHRETLDGLFALHARAAGPIGRSRPGHPPTVGDAWHLHGDAPCEALQRRRQAWSAHGLGLTAVLRCAQGAPALSRTADAWAILDAIDRAEPYVHQLAHFLGMSRQRLRRIGQAALRLPVARTPLDGREALRILRALAAIEGIPDARQKVAGIGHTTHLLARWPLRHSHARAAIDMFFHLIGTVRDLPHHPAGVRRWLRELVHGKGRAARAAREAARQAGNARQRMRTWPLASDQDGWRLLRIPASALPREGKRMGNCLADYADDVQAGDVLVFRLRQAPGTPQYSAALWVDGTLELRGRENAPAPPDAIEALRCHVDARLPGFANAGTSRVEI